jgi:sterol desaturase/sphingolipid hydroxylase (fatty acid hydroxylase superfamily)
MSQYWHWLIAISAFFVVLERLRPWRRSQPVLRRGWITDLCYLAFNGHFFSLLLAFGSVHSARWFAAAVDLEGWGLSNVASGWPIWVQVLIAFVGLDFVRWCVHNLLHRVPWLWEFHKVHHGIQELDWIGSFHFHWFEVVVYRAFLYVPLIVFGFDGTVMFASAVFSTFMGHFNHANLDVDIGPLKYVFNNPRLHVWHHDRDEVPLPGANFAIDFALWDYLFGTIWLPEEDRQPRRLGFAGIEKLGSTFAEQLVWPLWRRQEKSSPNPDPGKSP